MPPRRSCRLPGRWPRPITCSATSSCTRSSTTSRRSRRRARPTGAGIYACRSGSSRAWPSTCRSARSTRTPRCGCATRRRAMQLPSHQAARRSGVLSVSIRPRVLGLRRRTMGRPRRRGPASRGGHLDGDFKAAIKAILGVDEDQLTTDWHEANQESTSRRCTKPRGRPTPSDAP